MIFEDLSDVINTIKKYNTVPDWISKARKYHSEMKALIYGDEFKDLLIQIEHIETAKKAQARKKYSRPIKDTNAKILEPVNNVYSATGGGKVYNIESEDQKKLFLQELSNVRGGLSLERWLETYWSKDLYNIDPSGLMFLEWKDEKAWPTYKSIDTIRYYKQNGLNVEFVIFEPKTIENSRYWRVVDDAKSYTIKQDGELFVEVDDLTFNHDFGKCPARINSDKQQIGKEYRIAPIDNIIDAEKEFLRDRSILTIYKFLNGFATPYKPKIICPSCRGTKKQGKDNCPDCSGKGVILDKDVTDEIIIPIDLTAENPIQLPTNFAGFISPDLEIWNQYDNEAKKLFNEMFETIWGTRETEEVKDQTAQGAVLNLQPLVTRLNAWSNVAQEQEWAFTEMLANFYLNKEKSDRISIISYGRNYIIQPPEYLLSQYQISKEKMDGVVILDRKLTEYLTSKYKNDPETLRSELIKKDLELYVHYDMELVLKVYGQKEAQKKGLFTDWWETLDSKDLNKSMEALEAERDKWLDEKTTAILPQPNISNNE